MNKGRISIALATYNGEAYLEEQLTSLALQSCIPLELVVSDDLSSDRTADIVATFARHAPFPVRWIEHTTRLGFRGNFMRAAAACQGEQIAFCDQDDLWRDDKLAKIREALQSPGTLAAFHNANVVDAKGGFIRRFYAKPPAPTLSKSLTIQPWFYTFGFSLAIHRVLLSAIPFWPASHDPFDRSAPAAHDCFFFWLAASLGDVAYIDEALVDYRQHGKNVFGQPKPEYRFSAKRLSQKLSDPSEALAYLATVAKANGDVIRQTGRYADCDVAQEAWARAAAVWYHAAYLNAERASVYSAVTFVGRLAAYLRLCRKPGYSERGFLTFGRREALRDAILGVLAAPILRPLKWRHSHEGSLRRGRLSDPHG